MFLSDATRKRGGMVSHKASTSPHREGQFSGGGGRGIMAWARGVVLVRFPGGAGGERSGPPSGGALAPLRSLLGVGGSGSRAECRATLDAICIPPPPPPHLRLQVGGGRGVARRGSVFLAVTLIRCCVCMCPERVGLHLSCSRHTFCWKTWWVIPTPPPPPLPHSCSLQGRN